MHLAQGLEEQEELMQEEEGGAEALLALRAVLVEMLLLLMNGDWVDIVKGKEEVESQVVLEDMDLLLWILY